MVAKTKGEHVGNSAKPAKRSLTDHPSGFLDEATGEVIPLPDGMGRMEYAAQQFLEARERRDAADELREMWQAYIASKQEGEPLKVGVVELRPVTRRIKRFVAANFWQHLPAELTSNEKDLIIRAAKTFDRAMLPPVAQAAYDAASYEGETDPYLETKVRA